MIETVQHTILFDFNDPSSRQAWYILNDGVMGGISRSKTEATEEGMRFSGVVRLENNGGFASIRCQFRPADFSPYTGMMLRVRGDGKRYGIYFQNNFGPIMHQANFSTKTGEWQDVYVPFTALQVRWYGQPIIAPPLDLRRVVSINVIIEENQAGSFTLDLSRIALYQEIQTF
ncbi:MAG: CIA30 family protein [bacterium]|nr:CIA30 family protein [bacterium]